MIVEAVEDSSYGAVYKLDGARQLLEDLHLRLGS